VLALPPGSVGNEQRRSVHGFSSVPLAGLEVTKDSGRQAYAVRMTESICRSQLVNRFQLTRFWSTNLRS
jgi:hypothetical protein